MDGLLHQGNFRCEQKLSLSDLDQSTSTSVLLSDRELNSFTTLEQHNTCLIESIDRCIHHLFEANVERYPDCIAVTSTTQQITYRELDNQANQLADRLRSLGVQPEMLVGISVERSIEMVVGLLGILKAGGAYVPLDPDYPHERLAFIIKDTAMTILVTQSKLVAQLPQNQAKLVCIDRLAPDEQLVSLPEIVPIQPHNLVYTMYTSGSTGEPKGVQIEHRSLVNYAIAANAEYEVTVADRILQFASLNFDISAEEIYTALTSGATLVLRTAETISIDNFLQHCRAWQITIVSLPTAYWHELTVKLETDRHQLPPSLRLVIIGGEKAAISRFQAWQKVVGSQVRLINTYGPTEATIITLCTDLSDLEIDLDRSEVPIGRPLANVQVHVLDPDLQPVLIGAPGELHIAGAALARGYLNRAERNAARFIPNPFSQDFSGRLYKTGDLVRARRDGQIEFIGRIDRQVKIRGFRIELAEVETLIDRHPSIAQTVVVAREDSPGDKKLVAYCVADPRTPRPISSDLRNFIAKIAPDYMVPAMFVFLPSLPMNANGKVDLPALPAPADLSTDLNPNFVAPQNQIELELTKIWQQLLGQQSIGIKDNFFELGGHSLLAVRLFSHIDRIWGKSLPLATLLQAPTIESLAQFISQAEENTFWSSLVLIQAGATTKPPLFCIHPIGGNILEYYPLATYLGNERSIYGLQSQGLDGLQSPLDRIEDMASKYIQEIVTVEPNGPYRLMGYSLGGLIAFEIAHQLQSQGKQVDFLGLLDSPAPAIDINPVRPSLWKSCQLHLSNLKQLDRSAKIRYVSDRVNHRFKQVDYRELVIGELADVGTTMPHILDLIDINLQAACNYQPQVYRGSVCLFRCRVQSMQYALHQDLGWSKLVDGVLAINHIPGNHYGVLREPNIQLVAEELKLCMTR